MIFPDYQGGSIVNLMSSIITGRGGDGGHYVSLQDLDIDSLRAADNVVLLVIDGLGYDYLQNKKNSCLYQHLHSRITAVAPPTTAASITTFLTGLAPQQHALTGWFTYFRELGSVVTVLPYMTRAGCSPLGNMGVSVREFFGFEPVFDRMAVQSYSVSPEWLKTSEFNLAHLGKAELVPYSGYRHCFKEVARLAKQHGARKYIYAYWPGFDSLAHEHGVGGDNVAGHFTELDCAFEALLAELAHSNTIVLLTADHGFVDALPDQQVNIDDHPELKDCLMMPLCGEPRLAFCYVQHDKRDQFERYVREPLGEMCDLFASADLVNQGLFGLGEPHPELLSRVGDYTLVMKENYVITGRIPGEKPLIMRGFHGGLSEAEVYVPLVMAECV